MAEQADARDLKSRDGNIVPVRFRSAAPKRDARRVKPCGWFEKTVRSNPMFCSKCGTEMFDNSSFCTHCGTQVGTASPSPTFLSRKQFYTSSPQNQELYEKQILWSTLGATFSISNVLMLFILPPLMVITSIASVIFWVLSYSPSKKLGDMYKEYITQYQNQFPQPSL